MTQRISRREFLERTAQASAGLWVSMTLARPLATRAASVSNKPLALSRAEWAAVDAIASRIIPTDEDPGAREAGCVNFIDKALAHEDAPALPLYQLSLGYLDALCRARFESPFAELTEAEQDETLAGLEVGKAEPWPEGPIRPEVFFATIRFHVIAGFTADPRHGGNREFSGWKLLGYPGPRHHMGGGTPAQMLGKEKIRTVWGEEID